MFVTKKDGSVLVVGLLVVGGVFDVVGLLVWPCSLSCWKGVCRHLVGGVDVVLLVSMPAVVPLGLVVGISTPFVRSISPALASILGVVVTLGWVSKFLGPVT